MRSRMIGLLLAVLGSGGCTEDGDAYTVVPEARHVWSTSAVNTVLMDVAINGPHIAVLFSTGAVNLAISHDGGETFEAHDNISSNVTSPEVGVTAVMITETGQVFLVARRSTSSANPATNITYAPQRFFPDSGTHEGDFGPNVVGGPWARVKGERLEWYGRINPNGAFTFSSIDVSTGNANFAAAEFADPDLCVYAPFGPAVNGAAFTAYCTSPANICHVTANGDPDSQASIEPQLRCSPRSEFLAPSLDFEHIHAGWITYARGGLVFGERPAASGVERIEVGPGTPLPRPPGSVRSAFARYLPLGAPDVDAAQTLEVVRLLELNGNEAIEPDIPLSPCAADCPPPNGSQRHAGNLLWLSPLADDEHLAFYGVQDDEGGHFYMRRLASVREDIPHIPGGALEQACARLHACFPGYSGTDIRNCVYTFSQMKAPTDAEDRPYQELLSAAQGECDAFLGVAWGAWDAVSCTAGCVGGMAVACPDGSDGVASRRSCYELGTECRIDDVTSAAVCGPDAEFTDVTRCEGDLLVSSYEDPVVTDCSGLGLICDPTVLSCVSEEACVDEGTARCEGDVLVQSGCAGDREAAGFNVACGRLGMTCDAVNLVCDAGQTSACSEGEAPICEGSSLVYCVGGALHEIDCGSIGYSSCGLVDGVGTCQGQ